MDIQHYYVAKTSGTSADTLLAVGFARLLSWVLDQVGKAPQGTYVEDRGDTNAITLPAPITGEDVQQLKPFDLLWPLVTEKEAKKMEGLDGFDYEQQRQISNTYYTWRRETGGTGPDGPPPPHLLLTCYQAIQQMKIASSFNELVLRWHDLGNQQAEHIAVLLELFATPENDVDAAITRCQKLAKEHGAKTKMFSTSLQIVNPTTGKGSNRAKAANVPTAESQESFWLLELLKFVGFMAVAMPGVVQGSKDRKTYVVQPKTIELSTLDQLMQEFRRIGLSSTAVKLDILASLRLTLAFVTLRLQALQGEANEDDFLEEEQFYSLVHGLDVTFYKDMGSAYATMNVATLNLPYWLPQQITTLDEGETALALLQEHLHIIQYIRTIRDGRAQEGAEEYALLRSYRDFLSGRDLRPFWRFTTAYSSYLMSQREHEKNPKRHLRQFTLAGLEHLLMTNTLPAQKRLTMITQNEGFKQVAYAIRQATVKAQYRRSQERDRTYEVRYGLGQELMREVKYRDKFVAALATFLTQYNAETAREEEKLANRLERSREPQERKKLYQERKKLRRYVTPDDIDQVIALIDDKEFGAEIVGSLLIAYGYANDFAKRKTDGESEGDNEDDDSSSLNDDENP